MTTIDAPAPYGILSKYTACDIADALLKIGVPNAGHLADLRDFTSSSPITIGPAATVLFAVNDDSEYPFDKIPSTHWVDLTPPETIVVLSQPRDQKCAVLGGIMALRMKKLGAKAVVVDGRVRDVDELEKIGLPIWARAGSIVGSSAEARPYATQIPLQIDGTTVEPSDIVFIDPRNGVVVIPLRFVDRVIALLPTLVSADERVKKDVEAGVSVREAFRRHRNYGDSHV